MNNHHITLVCWSCGKKVFGTTNLLPQFAFEIVNIAEQAGMVGYFDFNHHRALIFCNKKCAEKQLTKKGTFRLRPQKIAGDVLEHQAD